MASAPKNQYLDWIESMKNKNRWDLKTIVLFLSLIGIIVVRTLAADREERKLQAKIQFLESELVEARMSLYRGHDEESCSCDICMGDY